MTLLEYIASRSDKLAFQTIQHASMIAQCVLIAAAVGVVIGILVHRNERATAMATGTTSVIFTIPSIAMLGLLIAPLGLGVAPSVTAITLYALLPILRNTVVGLNGVDSTLVDAARGIGMSRLRVLLRVQLPLAWPVILTGLRIATQLAMGIGAIAAFVSGPGLGDQIFSGLARIGAANALNATLVGTLGIVLLALLFDAVFVLIGKLTTSRGIRIHA
ncbi:osmoprotectant transport system permease protein [Spinactinospora alkalitolerans]|uniref:Osmoprotectant transport system permease protein n=1 Tax=Spinactinospora alkalitolerans TaxID=687207 RepID=A0A852TWM8_9ACTN|nr:ABC transporter permease [Spinactinospora alkalitolerans]NYE46260.1 osmoprotectant transport system permease protein [Spinactinospora alkalitolerans]